MKVKKAIKNLKDNWKIYSKNLERDLRNNCESLEGYFSEAVYIFEKYDQGSLSFTETKLKHVGYDYPHAILESIDSVK